MAVRGWATFAWQADYGQFYLIDGDDPAFQAPTEITAEMERRRFFVPAAGLVIYTHDCLQQHLRISIHDGEPNHAPVEWMSGKPWTQVEAATACFPSQRFTISSPSAPHPLPGGPVFFLDAVTMRVRISWMEFQGSRDDGVPVQPDVIEVTLWAP